MCETNDDIVSVAKPQHALLEEENDTEVTERVGCYVAGACNVMIIALADKIGLFRHMAGKAPSSSIQIAEQMGLSERWVRELLYQLASARLVSTETDAAAFWLTAAQARVLGCKKACAEGTADSFMLPVCLGVVQGGSNMDRLAEAFRTGRGPKCDDHGQGMDCAICRVFGAWTRKHLLENLQRMPGVHELLTAGATVADVGCGCGEALRVLGEAYPASTFHGYDISTNALSTARTNCAHLSNVSFRNPALEGQSMLHATYDFIITLDAVHDMARPDLILQAVRRGLKDESAGYLVSDSRSMGSPAENIREMGGEAMVAYAYSVMLCMSSSLSQEGGMGLGTLGWHPKLAKSMLLKAGFKNVEQLDWANPMNTFYHATL